MNRSILYHPETGRLIDIASVEVVRAGVLKLCWTDGTEREVDVSDSFGKNHPGLRQLADPKQFATVRVGEFGGIEWENGVDMCPHALRLKAEEQRPAHMAAAE